MNTTTAASPMICETRRIEFQAAAIATAIESAGPTMLALPLGVALTGLAILPEIGAVKIIYGASGTTRLITLPELAALLIAYCIDVRIPIPKHARKDLTLRAELASLVFTSTLPLTPRPRPKRWRQTPCAKRQVP